MTDFDIRHAVMEVLSTTDLADPTDIAAKVAESVPTRDLRRVLAFVLRDYVRVAITRARSPISPPTSTRSAKVTAIRDAAPRWLRERVFVGNSTWLLLGECTFENLKFLQAERVENAARSAAAAERYGRLADLVKRHKVSRVADLPRRVLDAGEWQEAA